MTIAISQKGSAGSQTGNCNTELPVDKEPSYMSTHAIPQEMQSNIRRIQEVFAEHFPQSYEEWVAGFVTESCPEHEIGIWLDAADTYLAFTRGASSPEKRKQVYRVVGACLTGMQEFAMHLIETKLKPTAISEAEAREVIEHFYALRESRTAYMQ